MEEKKIADGLNSLMTKNEAKKIIRIMLFDYLSENTSYWLIKDFARYFPRFSYIAKQMYLDKYGKTKVFDEEDFT